MLKGYSHYVEHLCGVLLGIMQMFSNGSAPTNSSKYTPKINRQSQLSGIVRL